MVLTEVLFDKVDALRREAGITIDELSEFIGVTPLAYKNWRKGAIPDSRREPDFRRVGKMLETALNDSWLPVPMFPQATKIRRRREVLAKLGKRFGRVELKPNQIRHIRDKEATSNVTDYFS